MSDKEKNKEIVKELMKLYIDADIRERITDRDIEIYKELKKENEEQGIYSPITLEDFMNRKNRMVPEEVEYSDVIEENQALADASELRKALKKSESTVSKNSNVVVEDVNEDKFLSNDENLDLPKEEQIEDTFISSAANQVLPNIDEINNKFLSNNPDVAKLKLPNVDEINNKFLSNNPDLANLKLPKVDQIGSKAISNTNEKNISKELSDSYIAMVEKYGKIEKLIKEQREIIKQLQNMEEEKKRLEQKLKDNDAAIKLL